MQGNCRLPGIAFSSGLLACALLFQGCTTWQPEQDPVPVEPEVVVVEPAPEVIAEPEPEPKPKPVIEVPTPPAAPPIAIILTSNVPAYVDIATELAAYFEDHVVYDLSQESLPPIAILRTINDSNSSAVVAVGLRAAQAAVSMSDKPVVFSQVFNYQQHDLLNDKSRGVAAIAPMRAQLSAWLEVSPHLKRVGLIIGEGHEEWLQNARVAAEELGLELDIRIAHSDQETLYIFRRMLATIDGFWLLPDSRVMSTRVLTEMFDDAPRHNVEVVVPNEAMLQLGAAISISTVASDIAKSIASVVRRMHAGETNQVPPITELTEVRVTVNE